MQTDLIKFLSSSKQKVLLLIFLCTLAFAAFPQIKDDSLHLSGRLHAKMPTASIEYLCHDKGSVRLKLHNNTIWAIAVRTDNSYENSGKMITITDDRQVYALPTNKLLTIRYQVENWAGPGEKVKIPPLYFSDTSFVSWLASGDSTLFQIPANRLKENLKISVELTYQWETESDGTIIPGPKHLLSFRGIDIPDKSVSCNK